MTQPQLQQRTLPLRRGWYDTEWGNVAFVSGPNAKTAHDVDMNERIPVECLCRETWRPKLRGVE